MDPVIRDVIFKTVNKIYRGEALIPGDDNFIYKSYIPGPD